MGGPLPRLSYFRPVSPVWSSFPDGRGFRDRPRWSATQLQKSKKLELRDGSDISSPLVKREETEVRAMPNRGHTIP